MIGFLILVASIAAGVLLTRLLAKRGTGKAKRRFAGVAVGVFAFIVLAVVLNPTARDGEASATAHTTAAPARVAAAAPQDPADAIKALAPRKISKVEFQTLAQPHQVWITVSQGESWSSASAMSDFGLNVFDVLKDGRKVLPSDADVIFVLRVPTVDAYGNKGEDKVLNLSISASDRAKINFDSGAFTSFSLLNLATPRVRNAIGTRMLGEFCSDDNYAKWAASFCMKATNA